MCVWCVRIARKAAEWDADGGRTEDESLSAPKAAVSPGEVDRVTGRTDLLCSCVFLPSSFTRFSVSSALNSSSKEKRNTKTKK